MRARILIVTPAPRGSRLGNRATALRWQRLLRALGHRVTVATELDERAWDVVIALHARKSAGAVFAARARGIPTVLMLTGTDLYRDVETSKEAQRALREADHLVVLQPQGIAQLPREVRRKARAILQSAVAARVPRARRGFPVVVVGHLREEKDPFCVADAARLLSEDSEIVITHVGAPLDEAHRARAERENGNRWRWIGERSPAVARAFIARAKLMVLPSRIEGGANVIAEALVANTPILASRIPSTVGMLGANHPGLFPVGDAKALARLLSRAERDPSYFRRLVAAGREKKVLFTPARERAALRALIHDCLSS